MSKKQTNSTARRGRPRGAKPRVFEADAGRLRKLFERAGLTQEGAAKELGLSPRIVRYYVAGEVQVPQVVWMALENFMERPGGTKRARA